MLSWLQRILGTGTAGDRGERLAAAWLRRERGFTIVARNWRSPRDRRDEIDLVARDGAVLAFVEVKTRGSDRFGAAADAVGREKQRHLASCAREYLRLLGNPRIPVRFDVVEVYMDEAGTADEVRLIQGAFATRQPLSD